MIFAHCHATRSCVLSRLLHKNTPEKREYKRYANRATNGARITAHSQRIILLSLDIVQQPAHDIQLSRYIFWAVLMDCKQSSADSRY